MSRINKFILQEKKGVKFFIVSAFSQTGLVKHGFSTRIGGVSNKPFASLNLGLHTGDDIEMVRDNRRLFAQSIGVDVADITAANQVHSDNVYIVTETDKGKGALDQDTVIPATDALITNKAGIPLIAFYADCVPIMFLDPKKKVIAIAHAGWKGTVARIGQKTVEAMEREFGCKPCNILAAIWPSIGPCHYEVGKTVIDEVKKNFPLWEGVLKFTSEDKAFLNLWEANRLQLEEAGIPAINIANCQICTFCHPELFFSYRYDQGKTGRMAGLIMLNEE